MTHLDVAVEAMKVMLPQFLVQKAGPGLRWNKVEQRYEVTGPDKHLNDLAKICFDVAEALVNEHVKRFDMAMNKRPGHYHASFKWAPQKTADDLSFSKPVDCAGMDEYPGDILPTTDTPPTNEA